LWYLPYPKGEISRITNDLNEYRGLSLSADSSTLSTVRIEQASDIWTLRNANSEAKQITTDASSLDGLWGVSWTADKRLIYTSTSSGNEDLWIMSDSGQNARQLTIGEMAKVAPSACGEGGNAVFMSRSAEGTHIWRIGLDGNGLKQITNGASEGIPQCIDDHSFLYVKPGEGGWSLWKESLDGGKAFRLSEVPSLGPAVSPDGKWIAYAFLDEMHNKKIAIISSAGGPPAHTLPLSSTVLVDTGVGLKWTTDSKALAYVDLCNGVPNLCVQPVEGGDPKQITSFKSGEIFSYDIAHDGTIALARGTLSRNVVLIRNFTVSSQ